MKLVMLIKMRLIKTSSRVCMGKYLSNIFLSKMVWVGIIKLYFRDMEWSFFYSIDRA
jgi:hypothetical protein